MASPEDAERVYRPIGETVEDVNAHTEDEPEAFVQNQVMGLDSLCVACEENGKTNMLLTSIPFFRDVILVAFHCHHCGFRSSEVQSAEVQEKGLKFSVKITAASDLNRQVIKSNAGVVTVPEVELEIPADTQKGVFTTVEGLLTTTIDNLEQNQPLRKAMDPETYEKVKAFLAKLRAMASGEALPFTVELDDPSGNSFIENPRAPSSDPQMTVTHYFRTTEQNHALGMFSGNAADGAELPSDAAPRGDGDGGGDDDTKATAVDAEGKRAGDDAVGVDEATGAGHGPCSTLEGDSGTVWRNKPGARITELTDRAKAGPKRGEDGSLAGIIFDSSSSDTAKEVMAFAVDCHACQAPGETRMCCTDVPHFKEIIVMSFVCDDCGFRSVEVKSGGGVPEKGTVSELKLTPGEAMEEDLRRDVIKSDTASIHIPELDLELSHGSLGGVYTTVEGLLMLIHDKLVESNPFHAEAGDSAAGEQVTAFRFFLQRLRQLTTGEVPFTLRIVDPMASTFVYSPYAPDPDPRLVHNRYERTHDENLELGLLDMVTEGYNLEVEAELAAEAEAEAAARGEVYTPTTATAATDVAPTAPRTHVRAGAGAGAGATGMPTVAEGGEEDDDDGGEEQETKQAEDGDADGDDGDGDRKTKAADAVTPTATT